MTTTVIRASIHPVVGRLTSKISRSLEAARFGFKLVRSLWKLTGDSAAPLPRCLPNFRAIWLWWNPISRLRDFARFGGKTFYRSVNTGPEIFVALLFAPHKANDAQNAFSCLDKSKWNVRHYVFGDHRELLTKLINYQITMFSCHWTSV